jgi:hypothetical protein
VRPDLIWAGCELVIEILQRLNNDFFFFTCRVHSDSVLAFAGLDITGNHPKKTATSFFVVLPLTHLPSLSGLGNPQHGHEEATPHWIFPHDCRKVPRVAVERLRRRVEPDKVVFLRELLNDRRGGAGDGSMMGEQVSGLADVDGSRLPGPSVYVAEQVTAYRLQLTEIETPTQRRL